MRNILLSLSMILLSHCTWHGLCDAANGRWTSASAHTIPKKAVEFSIFQPMRVGLGEQLELDVHPLFFFTLPHAYLKVGWTKIGNWSMATTHGASYATLPGIGVFTLLSRRGTGGILPLKDLGPAQEGPTLPQMFALHNEVLFSGPLTWRHRPTLKVGVDLGLSVGDRDNVSSIDLPFVYPRMATYLYHATFRLAAGLDGVLYGPLRYSLSIEAFGILNPDAPFILEQSLLLSWQATKKFALLLGYKLSVGVFPYGPDFHILPMLDLQWFFG